MDLRKVFDQTVRDLKREVNKKVLKVPEIEQKVLDATSNEPWGPHGTAMSEIAQATRNFNDYQMIMTILWKRLADTGRNWRHVYKGLTLFDFLVAHGADRVVDELRENIYQIQGLVDFQYVEPNGKDQGINIRKKAQALVALLNDKGKIREVRQKASTNRDKYQGYSSTGGTFKPSSYSSSGSRGFSDWDDDRNGHGRDEDDRYGSSNSQYRKENDRYRDDWRADREDDSSRSPDPPSYETSQKQSPVHQVSSVDGDDDDFDPRASKKPTSAPTAAAVPEMDLLGQLDFFSTPTTSVDPFASPDLASAPKSQSTSSNLFASDAFSSDFGAFTSAEPTKGTSKTDFFSPEPSKTTSSTDFFSEELNIQTDLFATDHHQAIGHAADPFAPLKFENEVGPSDDSSSALNSFEAFGTHSQAPAAASAFAPSTTAPSVSQTTQTFQTKSSVWADSLTSGLIDLNITAPKDTPSMDFGDWTRDPKQLSSGFQAKPMGAGSGLGIAGASGLAPPPAPAGMAADPFGFGASTTNGGFFSTAGPINRNASSTANDPFAGLG